LLFLFIPRLTFHPFGRTVLKFNLPSRAVINIDKVCFHSFQRPEWEMLKYHMKDLAYRISSWDWRLQCWKVTQGIQTSWYFQTNFGTPGDWGKLKFLQSHPTQRGWMGSHRQVFLRISCVYNILVCEDFCALDGEGKAIFHLM
jgi:hypothetical protein